MTIHISVDSMGGDNGLDVTLPSCVDAIRKDRQLMITAVVNDISVSKDFVNVDRLSFISAKSVVSMSEDPIKAMRYKLNSTMGEALSLISQSKCDAMITAGNTGALVALGHRILGSNIDKSRPAIMTTLPSRNGDVYLLDSGANIQCTPELLLNFALNAKEYIALVNPRVGLLNIGHESSKGTELVQKTSQLMQENPTLNYVGFVEPKDVLLGNVDIVVCDGFVGNIFLKTLESGLDYVLYRQRKVLDRFFITRLLSGRFIDLMQRLKKKYSRSKHAYGIVLGLNGAVYKAHGSTTRHIFTDALIHIANHIRQKNSVVT